MPDETIATKHNAPPPEPAFNGSGHTKGENGEAATKYAPPKPDEGGDKPAPEKPAMSARKKLLLLMAGAAALLFAIIWGTNYYHYSHTHVGTDDAQVNGNLVNVSPIISGTLSQLTVDEGDTVRKGQQIGRLEDSGPQAALRQAQAAYNAALSQLPQAQATLAYEQQATDAGIQRAQAAVAAQRAKTQGAQQQATVSGATVRNQLVQAQSQFKATEAQAEGVQAQVKTAQATVDAQRQAVQTARRAAEAAASQIASASANAQKASNDQKRYAVLVRQEAVTPQQYDAAQAAAVSAASQLEAAQAQAAQARSQVAFAQAGVAQALAQLQAAQKQASAARQQSDVARAGVGLAQANLGQVGIQQSNVANAVGQGTQAEADLATALAGREQVTLRRRQIATYQAQAEQAKAALANARVTYQDTFLYAPADGHVVKKAVNVGAALAPGQTVVTITQSNQVWVTANFKETQLRDVVVGQPCEVEVDTFPGTVFSGKVQAINEATGASLALLPPDNSTGNFTKVVQRIPVKIALVAASNDADKKYARARDIQRLRQGMSVNATIDTSRH